jgi:hypothetical protein
MRAVTRCWLGLAAACSGWTPGWSSAISRQPSRASEQRSSRAQEDDALDSLGVKNNNRNTGDERESFPKPSGNGETRQDGVTDDAVVDVKAIKNGPDPDGNPRVLNDRDQLRGQRAGAEDSGRDHVVVISNETPEAVRPSGPLAEKSTVMHRNPETNEFSVWNPEANGNEGSWEPISNAEARSMVGGTTEASPNGPSPVHSDEDDDAGDDGLQPGMDGLF